MEEIFIKEIQSQNYKKNLYKVEKFIDEILIYGQHIMSKVNIKSNCNYSDSVILLLFREALEILDGIKSLYKCSSINVSEILMRNLFENMIYFDYIFMDNSLIEKRALSYEVDDINRRINLYKKYNNNNEYSQGFENKSGQEIIEKFDPNILDEKIKNLESMFLKYEQYKEVNEERKRKKKKINKRRGNRKDIEPVWYQIYSDAKNFRELCVLVGMEKYYMTLYKTWSSKVHPAVAMQGINVINSKANIRNPKVPNPTQVASNIGMILTFMSSIYQCLTRYYLSDSQVIEMGKWHFKMRNKENEICKVWNNIKYVYK